MLTANYLSDSLLNTPGTLLNYKYWSIAENGESFDEGFRKAIMYGFQRKIKAVSVTAHILDEDMKEATELCKKHVASGGLIPFEIILRYNTIHGTAIQILCKAKVTEWSMQGAALKMEGFYMDISAAKNTITRDQEQHRLIIEGINAGIWDLNVRTGELWCSDKVYELIGYRRDEIPSTYHTFLHELLHPDDLKRTEEMMTSRFKTSAPYINDIRIKHKDGTYHWFETSGKAKLDRNGRPVRIVGSLTSKDQRRRILSELERYQFLINESTALIKAGSWEINFASDTLTWSPSMFEIHETDEDFRPLIRNLFQFLQEKDRILFKRLLKEAYHNGESYDITFYSVTAKGNRKWIRTIGKPVINVDGTITAIRGITQDIHEQKLKDEQIKHSIDLITAKNESLNNFAQIVSHNLRSHAGNMESILKLLETNTNPEQQQDLLGYLKKISSNLNQTIEHLTDTLKMQNSSAIPKARIVLNQALNEVLDVLRPTINETNTIIIHDTTEYEDIEYVPAYFESIILNLVSNAIKYRKPETQPIITIKTFLKDGRKCLSVTDNGLGIDLTRHGSKLFGMYKTFHANPDAIGIDRKNSAKSTNYVYLEHKKGLSDELVAIATEMNHASKQNTTLIDASGMGFTSDNQPFVNEHVPFLYFSTGRTEFYHQPADEANTIDYDQMAVNVKLIFATAWQVANQDKRISSQRNHLEKTGFICHPCGLPCDKLQFSQAGICPVCGMWLVQGYSKD